MRVQPICAAASISRGAVLVGGLRAVARSCDLGVTGYTGRGSKTTEVLMRFADVPTAVSVSAPTSVAASSPSSTSTFVHPWPRAFGGSSRAFLAGFLLAAFPLANCECETEVIEDLVPVLNVSPNEVNQSAPIAADTNIVITLENPSLIPLDILSVALKEGSDPAFRLVSFPDDVGSAGVQQVVVVVRPQLTSTITATLVIDAQPDTSPSAHVEVPITVEAQDLGLPDIEVEPTEFAFDRVGQNDVARGSIVVRNVGVRDLILDSSTFIPDAADDSSIRLVTPLPAGFALPPRQSVSLDMVFAPRDTSIHSGVLEIVSSDPDEPLVQVPVTGQGQDCPIAVITVLDDISAIEPLDTIRLDGHDSYSTTEGVTIDSYEWILEQRPVGSTSVPSDPEQDRTEFTCDLAGQYVMRLVVTDSTGVRSCNDALVRLDVVPTDDLHVQLVWDHPTADFDMHFLREGGELFNHDGDVYFSNREPDWFPANQDSNPRLDVDDNRGYGPENINIKAPFAGSRWTIKAHYWNKQTDGDAFAIATLRIFARGQLVTEISQPFENDQTVWSAAEIVWPVAGVDLPTINPLNQLEPFVRPF